VNRFDVSVYAIRRRSGRRRPFEVRWRAAGRSRSKSFITRKLADSYRAELVRAARNGPGVRPADRRADGMEPPGTRDRHLVPGSHRVRGDEMAVAGCALPGQPGRSARHGHARTGQEGRVQAARSARTAHGLVSARLQSSPPSRTGQRMRADPGLGTAGITARRLPQRAGRPARRARGADVPAGRQPGRPPTPSSASAPSCTARSATRPRPGCCRTTRWTPSPGKCRDRRQPSTPW
jgi:hypothetical protein